MFDVIGVSAVAGLFFYLLRSVGFVGDEYYPWTTTPRVAAFQATRLTTSTFKIVEYDDIYNEQPFIYAKVFPDVLILIDSGCGGATENPDINVKELREFLETIPIAHNKGEPLNAGGRRKYGIITTHCHYDHILAIDQFANDSVIFASSHSPSFLSPKNFPKNSLCERLGIETPSYTPTLVPHNVSLSYMNTATRLRFLHTPGHTPDELAIWDDDEDILYVGDTVYEWDPIIFPLQGDISVWFDSMNFLIEFVRERNEQNYKRGRPTARINSGHATSMADALDVLLEGKKFLQDVVAGNEPLKNRTESGGVVQVHYAQENGRFSLRCPEALIEEARTDYKP
ncbi:Metallo-hydrolase/oxidoreductase [Schizopora paradoxa]|uniref:Metallo-hydrolase/oxidoreductase n=1 Tax=Schizopora paradoxa TaxID=27342 RepID=A0A0H2RH59_9AGAM|nr:Metallo-hydrolase/oxidoreductase [Schizopora paradoxa]